MNNSVFRTQNKEGIQHLWKSICSYFLGVLTLACLFKKRLHSQILMHSLKIV